MTDNLCFIDTNIWLYAFINDQHPEKHELAKSLIRENDIVISSQIVNETCCNLIKKASFNEDVVRQIVAKFYKKYCLIEVNETVIQKASHLRQSYKVSYWDSLIVASALLSGTERLYSEDMHHGLKIEEKLEVINPFI